MRSYILKNKQYGKSSASYIKQKQLYFDDNDKHIEVQKNIRHLYAAANSIAL